MWNELKDVDQLDLIEKESAEKTILIFKHSTRCSTSRMVLDRLQRNWNAEEMKSVKPYFLDLISYRAISNAIAERFAVRHESPQVIMLKDNRLFYNESHYGIDFHIIRDIIKNQKSQTELANRLN